MKLADELYQLYKDQLTGDEEDAMIIVSGILEDMQRADYLELIGQLSEEELFEMFGNYAVYKLRLKMLEEGLGHHDGNTAIGDVDGFLH